MKKTKLERYHEDYVSQRRVERVVAVTPEAMEIESRAIERERRGHYRIAARLWLQCLDAAVGEVERARIAVRASSASPKVTAPRIWTTAGSDVAGWCMTNPHDGITVGSVTPPYSINRRGWVAPSGDVIRNPLKAQRLAELMNSKKVAA